MCFFLPTHSKKMRNELSRREKSFLDLDKTDFLSSYSENNVIKGYCLLRDVYCDFLTVLSFLDDFLCFALIRC